MKRIIIILAILNVFSCSSKNKNEDLDRDQNIIFSDNSDRVKDSVYVLSLDKQCLLGDSVNFEISPKDVSYFFMNSEEVFETYAIDLILEDNYKYSISGNLIINNDTLVYIILPSGLGLCMKNRFKKGTIELVMKEKREIRFFKGIVDIPTDTFVKMISSINILNYEKNNFDYDLWELWKKEYPEYTVDGNEEYLSYKRWNKLDVNGIYKAFNLCKKVGSYPEIDYMHTVDHNCNLYGYLIKNKQLYRFYMDGGGVFYLDLLNRKKTDELEIYGCFTADCLQYFTGYLHSLDEGID